VIRAAILAGALLFLAAPPRALAGTPDEDLTTAEKSYEQGDYRAVITLLRPLLYPKIALPSREKSLRARRLLGLSYLFEKDPAEAEKQFLAILSQRPDYQLDTLVDPAAAVEFFQRIKRRNAEMLEAIRKREEYERRRREQQAAQAAALKEDAKSEKDRRKGEYLVRTVVKRNFWINLAPFGAGQFQNGQRAKGFALLGLQAGLGALSLGTYLGQRFGYEDGEVSGDDWNTAQGLRYTQIISGSLCLAVIAYGIIDAIAFYKPETVTEEWVEWKPDKKRGGGKKKQPEKQKQKKEKKDEAKPARGAFLFGPSVGPGGASLTLGFTF